MSDISDFRVEQQETIKRVGELKLLAEQHELYEKDIVIFVTRVDRMLQFTSIINSDSALNIYKGMWDSYEVEMTNVRRQLLKRIKFKEKELEKPKK
jgi:hypothetical protein